MISAKSLSTFLFQRPRLALGLLLGPPLLAFVLIYLGSLLALLAQSFFALDHYTAQVVPRLTLATYSELLSHANVDIVLRTAGMAVAVTIAAALLAFPLAYYMALRASPRLRAFLTLAVLVPLWSSYLVRVYAWKLLLAREGIVSWFAAASGTSGILERWLALPVVGGPSLSMSMTGMFLAFLYVWLPFMILPIQAALERVPRSLLEASSDLGARPAATFRQITLPLALAGCRRRVDLHLLADPG